MDSSLPADIVENMHALLSSYREQIRKSLDTIHPDLTFNEMRVLMRTGRHPGITQRDLVEHSHTDKAQMARLLSTLQNKGWLTRSPSQDDKRVRCLHLSAEGQQLFIELRKLQDRIASRLLQGCPPASQQQLLVLMQQARTSANQHMKQADTGLDATAPVETH